MGLKSILETLDNVPEELHDHYEERDGKYVLALEEDVKTHPTVSALSNAYRQEQTRRREMASKVEALEARFADLPEDFDAEAYEELKRRAEEKEPPKTDDQVVRVREQLERRHAADLQKKDERIAKLEAAVEKKTIDDGLSKAMDEANIDPKHKKKLTPYLKSLGKIKLEESDDGYLALVETDMGPADLTKFVTDWASSEDGKDYVGKPRGLDTTGSDGRKSEPNPWAKDSHNLTAQGQILRADRSKARRMMKAAGVSDAQIDQRLGAA